MDAEKRGMKMCNFLLPPGVSCDTIHPIRKGYDRE